MNITLNRLICNSALAALCSFSALTLAQDQPTYSGWTITANLDHINFDSAAASRPDVLISESGTAIGLAGEYLDSGRSMTYVVGLNYIIYNDNNEFAQYVQDYWYNDRYDGSYEESSANALMLFAEAGPKIHFGTYHSSFFSARVGVSQIFDSTRSIDFCSDCYSEDIDIEGGFYGSLGIGHSFDQFDIGAEFQQYFSGDIDNSLRLKMAFSF